MKYFLPLFLLLITYSLAAEEEKPREFSQEELQERFTTAEERYKDNPQMLRVIEQLKEGITAKYKQQETPPPPAEPAFDASKDTAGNAYKNADYETAFKHYKALAEQGDPEAAMMLGVMYQGGLGTEKDNAAAHAWYKKSSEEGMSGSGALLEVIEEDDMSLEELQQADKYYADISEQEVTDKGGGSEESAYGNITAELPAVIKPARDYQDTQQTGHTRQVRFVPEKISPVQHPSPTVTRGQHIQPDRFFRNKPAG